MSDRLIINLSNELRKPNRGLTLIHPGIFETEWSNQAAACEGLIAEVLARCAGRAGQELSADGAKESAESGLLERGCA